MPASKRIDVLKDYLRKNKERTYKEDERDVFINDMRNLYDLEINTTSPQTALEVITLHIANVMNNWRDYETLNKLIKKTKEFYAKSTLNSNRSKIKILLGRQFKKGSEKEKTFKKQSKRLFDADATIELRDKYDKVVKARAKETDYKLNLSEVLNFVENNIDLKMDVDNNNSNTRHHNTYRKMAAIMLAAGTRGNESMGKPFSKFKAVGDYELQLLYSKKQTRNGRIPMKVLAIRDTLVKAKRVMAAINDLNTHETVETKKGLAKKNKGISFSNINNYFKSDSRFNFIPEPLRSVDNLRAIGMISAHAMHAKNNHLITVYIAEKYGHMSSATSASYATKATVINDLSDNLSAKNQELVDTVDINKRLNDITSDLEKIKITECSLNNNNRLSNEDKIKNIKLLISKGYKSYASLKRFGYGYRIIKLAKESEEK
jgi:hypothetical protein